MKDIAGTLSAAGMRFGIVVSRFNSFFTEKRFRSQKAKRVCRCLSDGIRRRWKSRRQI